MKSNTRHSRHVLRSSFAMAAAIALAACGGSAPATGPAPVSPQETATAPDATVPAAERLHSILPPADPVTSVQFPAFTEATLENGARVIVVENHEQPVVSFNLRIQTGTSSEATVSACRCRYANEA